MRLIFMGTGPFAVPSFEMLRDRGEEILAVISRPEVVSKGDKKGPPPSPVRLWAESHGLPTTAPASINTDDSIQWLSDFKADLLFVCDYGQILKREVLSTARLGGINLHGSLLPRHRGAAPVQWSVLSGDRMAGVSVIHMTPGLDAGPVIATAATEILSSEDAGGLETRLSQLGVEATRNAIQTLSEWDPNGTAPGILQEGGLATKAPRLSKSDGQLDPRYHLRYLDRQIRGLQPWPGCFANLQLASGTALRLIIKRASPLSIAPACLAKGQTTLAVGQVLYGELIKSIVEDHSELRDIDLAIVAEDGLLVLHEVQPAGKRSMTASEFSRGYAKQEWMRVEPTCDTHPLLERMAQLEIK